MVRLIRKTLFAWIKKCKVLFFAMIFICASAVAMGVGFLSCYYNFISSVDSFINDYGMPDVTLTLDNFYSEDELKEMLDGVDYTVDYRFQYNLSGKLNGAPITVDVRTIDDDSFAKIFYYEKIDEKPNCLNLAVHKSFAENNNLRVGDSIAVSLSKSGELFEGYINAIVQTPEAFKFSINGRITVDKYDYTVAFCSAESINNFLPEIWKNKVNQIIVKTDEEHAEADKNICKILTENEIKVAGSFTRENSISIKYIETICDEILTISVIIPILFLAIALIFIFLFLFQIIRSFLHEIGIMNALGIKKIDILGLMVSFSFIIAIVSSVLGIGLSFILTVNMSKFYSLNYGVPLTNTSPSISLSLIVSGLIIFICVLASITTMLVIKGIRPKDAIANNATQFKPMSKGMNKITENASIETKININNIHKNILRFVVSILTFASSYTLIFGALHYYTGDEFIIDGLIERYDYDAEIYSLTNISCDNALARDEFTNSISSLASIDKFSPVLLTSVKLKFGDMEESITLCGMKNNDLFTIPCQDENICTVEPNCVVLEKAIAESLGVKINDVVEINGAELRVNQISFQTHTKYHYVDYDTMLTRIKPSIVLDLIAVNISDKNIFYEEIENAPINTHVLFMDKNVKSITKGIKTTEIASVVISIFAFVIGFLIIFIMNMENLSTQKRKFSILCCLGKKKSFVAKLLLEQNIITFVIGIIIGIPSGIGFAKLLCMIASDKKMTLQFTNDVWIYIASLCATIMYLIATYFVNYKIIKKWNISENIKTRE